MAKLIKTLRDFPSVEEMLESSELKKAVSSVPRPVAALVVKNEMKYFKDGLQKDKNPVSFNEFIRKIEKEIAVLKRKEITKVINATGIVIHTNLGRAPLSGELIDSVKNDIVGYGNIEFDLSSGKRGKRGEACERYLALLSGSESGTIVNNCAAALFIILNSFSNRKKVIISRSELVQIGGGFRIPDILKKSGARLCEIGTSNITTLKDYEDAIDDKTGLILKVHQSNFTQRGFVESVTLKDLSSLASKYDLPLINDLGSGVFIPTGRILNFAEQTVQQSVRDKADLTCFSGDKMLGGVQSGLIVGKKEMVEKIKKNPLFRTFRVDKLIYSIMEKTLTSYLNNTWQEDIKVWSLMTTPESELYKRGKDILKKLKNPDGVSVEASSAYVGGGALPDSKIASVSIVFSSQYKSETIMRKFRELKMPIIGRIENDCFYLDLKTVYPEDLVYLTDSIKKVIAS